MALPIIPKPPFPNVPNALGVPTLKRNGLQTPVARAIISKIQGEIWRALTTESNWGIFSTDNKPLVIADSVLEVSYKNASKIAQHPVAEGSFASYNKVASPFEITLRLTKGSGLKTLGEIANVLQNGIGNIGKGAVNARTEFLDTIDELSKSTQLVHIVTPEKTYIGCNIIEYDYRREQSNGAHMLIVDIKIAEVRETKAVYSKQQAPVSTENAKSPDAKPPENNGKVQPQPVKNESVLKSMVG